MVGVLVGVSVGAHEKAQPDGCALRLGHMQKFWLVEGVAGMTFDSTAKAKLSSRVSPIAVNAAAPIPAPPMSGHCMLRIAMPCALQFFGGL